MCVPYDMCTNILLIFIFCALGYFSFEKILFSFWTFLDNSFITDKCLFDFSPKFQVIRSLDPGPSQEPLLVENVPDPLAGEQVTLRITQVFYIKLQISTTLRFIMWWKLTKNSLFHCEIYFIWHHFCFVQNYVFKYVISIVS